MAHYKDLNKELVEQVQAMRISLQEHREEIINLRHKWMCEHEDLVKMREKCNAMALMHCRQYLELLDPESPLLSSLPNDDQIITSTNAQGSQISKRRQSSRLSDECRRSSCLTQTRKSFNATSPIKSSASNLNEVREDDDDDDVVETEVDSTPGMASDAILEEDEEEQEYTKHDTNDKTRNETKQSMETTKTGSTLSQSTISIEEESTGSETLELANSKGNTIVHKTRSFRDITNIVNSSINTSQKTLSKKSTNSTSENKNSHRLKHRVSKRNKTSNSFSSDSENENATPLNSPRKILEKTHGDKNSNHVTVSRGKPRILKKSIHLSQNVEKQSNIKTNRSGRKVTKKVTDSDMELDSNSDESHIEEEEIDVDEESIQEARYMTKEIQCTGESFHEPIVEDTAGSCAISEISFSQFDEATSSTPRQPVRNTMPSYSSPGHSSRPKRSCKPKSMVEPRINAKMRNESNEKSLTNYKKKCQLKK